MNPVMMALMPWVRQGYCCGQLLTLLMMQAMERENPDLVCAAGGLCHGLGHSDGPCGLLTSGALALALAAGTAQDGVSPHPMRTPVIHELCRLVLRAGGMIEIGRASCRERV